MKRLPLIITCFFVALLLCACGLTDSAYQQAYDAGFQDGVESGYKDGYDDGLADGEDSSYKEGYSAGFNDGQIDGYNKARKTWNNSSSSSSTAVENYSYAALLQPSSESTNDYVLNRNTKKFHYPWCSSVDDIAEHNKIYYTGTREEVIGMGFIPCKRCNP